MKRYTWLCLSVFLLVTCVTPARVIAQKKEQQGLLWRITGNGLSAPSYLYGTIHLTDNRVFNFGDSLYACMEKSDGYAMELNPDSLMIEYFKENSKTNTTLLKDVISSSDFNRIKKKLQERFSKSPDKVTVKEFKQYFNAWINQVNEKGNMQTFMDAYFYNIARRQGKWVGGIEDVADQLYLRDDKPELEDYYINDFLDDNRANKQYMEKMISVYIDENIELIEKMSEADDDSKTSRNMLRRNHKMTYRIDSLAHIRSTFFAIGAAHLPGDSGVINSLRLHGFTLEPVTSTKRIHASEYKFPVKQVPWVTVTSNTGLYTIQMPGEPQKNAVDLDYDNMDMKLYADISTNLFYLSMGISGSQQNEDSVMNRVVGNLDKKATVKESHAISLNGVRGKEILATAEKITYRMQVFFDSATIYFTLIGSPVKDAIYSDDANRFFKSLSINKNVAIKSVTWQAFHDTDFGFSVLFPGKPKVKKQDPGEDKSITTTHYSAIDLRHNVFYQCLVQDMNRGYFLVNDTAIFGSYRDQLIANDACKVLNAHMDTVQNYPAMWVEFMMSSGKNSFYNKVLNVHHGNRIFYLFATAEDGVKNKPVIDSFFNSFAFTSVKEPAWSQQSSPDKSFSTWATGTISESHDSTEDSRTVLHDMYDPSAPVTFYIRKYPYTPYFWDESDTALLRREINYNVKYSDSLLDFRFVTNGSYKGAEAIIRVPDNHNLKKMRMLLVGDTLFTIYGITLREYFQKENCLRFFSEFRINHAPPVTTLFESKAAKLLEALRSTDSATFQTAKTTLGVVSFRTSDLPLLHKYMLEQYSDSTEYDNVNKKLFSIVSSLNDTNTVNFVKQVYEGLSPEKETKRYELLRLLALRKTTESYSLLKELLMKRPPVAGAPIRLFAAMTDSLALVAPLFNDLLPLLKDSLSKWRIVFLAEDLLDSNLIDKKLLLPYKKDFANLAAIALKVLETNDEPDELYYYHSLVRVLGKFGQPGDFLLIRKFLLQKSKYLKYIAATTLINNKQPVEAPELTKLAADNDYRVELYDFLNEINKSSLFPVKYKTQQAMAEGDLYSYASDENDVKAIVFIGERTRMYKGVLQKFYLFKVDMSSEDEKSIHLGIAGPYKTKAGKLSTSGEATGIVWSTAFDKTTIDADLKKYLSEVEEY